MSDTFDVLIIGAGLAGMTAAVYASDAGKKVCVVEANSFLGGRTSSWTEDGMAVESGLHRFLGFYTALPSVLKKVGIDLNKLLYWEDEIEIRTADGPSAVFGLAPLFSPLKTITTALGNNDFLSTADKISLGKMFMAAAREYVTHPDELDQVSVLEYAKKHKVTHDAIHRALVPLTEGIFFLPLNLYSMYNLTGLFMPYLKSLPKLRIGAFMGGMSEVMMQPMANYVTDRNGVVRLDSPAHELMVEDGRVFGACVNGELYRAKKIILATPLHTAQELLQKDFGNHPKLQDMFSLPTMPAVTFQMELSKPALPVDRTTFGPMTCLSSFAEQSRTTFRESAGRLSIILSPPEKFIKMTDNKILDIVEADAKKLGLDLDKTIVSYRTVRLPDDFYSLATGNNKLRPPQDVSIPGLLLAGDYTKQPYLATMEGAVVSGKIAAEAAIARI
jgi:15-cis-phytoene desaturase